MAASRKPGLLRILPGNRYFSQPKCCKHCGMRNYESEPSLPPIPTAAPPLSPKNSGSNIRSGLFSLCLGLQGRFPNLSTHLSRKKRKRSGVILPRSGGTTGWEPQESQHCPCPQVPHPQCCETPPGMGTPPIHCFSSSFPFLGLSIPAQSQEQHWWAREVYGINKEMKRNWKNSCNFPTWGSNPCQPQQLSRIPYGFMAAETFAAGF